MRTEILLYFTAVILSAVAGIAFLAYKRNSPHLGKWNGVVAFGIVSALFLPLCCSLGRFIFSSITEAIISRPLHPTYDDLIAHGFYVFVLPEDEVEKRGWKQDIQIWSWNVHCGLLVGDTYNPLQVLYRDTAGERVLDIQLGLWGIVWDYSKPATKVEVDLKSEWSSTGTLIYYTQTTSERLPRRLYHFSDMLGLGVEVRSDFPITETIKLIEQLEYIGPGIETLKNPWNCETQ